MKRTLGTALLTGLVGGIVSHYLVPLPVIAQAHPFVQKEVRAESFVLTDGGGNTVGVFTTKIVQRDQRAIILLDQNGKQIWSAGDSPLRQLGQK